MQFAQLKTVFSYLSEEQWLRLAHNFHALVVPAKTVLLREGELARKVFFIEQGCLRVWFNNNGRDITCQFFFEGQVVSSLESFHKNIPSFFTIESIEPCNLCWIDKKDLQELDRELKQYPEYNEQFLQFLMGRQFHYMKEFLSFIKDTPARRYQNLLETQPQIIRRVPQHYIASYLGITSVSLSRIRARLQQDKK